MLSLTDVLHDLVRRGLTLRVDQGGQLFIYDPRHTTPPAPEKAPDPAPGQPAPQPHATPPEPADPMARRHAAALAERIRRSSIPQPGSPPPASPGPHWRGITWQDVPGHDEHTQKLNFSLLKRGLLRGHRSCTHLEGPALKQHLQDLSQRNRDNSRNRAAQCRPRPP